MTWTMLCALLVAAVAGAIQDGDARRAPELRGRLYRSVFSSGADVLTRADAARVPEPLRARLLAYLDRREAFRSRYRNQATSLDVARADAKKRALERAIVSLLDIPGIEVMAADLVAGATVFDDWQGTQDRPLEEARHAEGVLKADPSSPLAPWLFVFIAHRQRVAFEIYAAGKFEEGMRTTAKKYRAFAERTRSVGDPLFPALLDDMEQQPYLYMKAAQHPRDFNPDT